jgi:hypothetical protein
MKNRSSLLPFFIVVATLASLLLSCEKENKLQPDPSFVKDLFGGACVP